MTSVAIANGVMQSSLVLAGSLAVAWVLRRRSAALRHAIVAAGVLGALATPVIRSLMPEWEQSPVSGVILLEGSVPELPAGDTASDPVSQPQHQWSVAGIALAVWGGGALLGVLGLGVGLFRLRQLRKSGGEMARSWWHHVVHPETASLATRRRVTVIEVDHPTFTATWGAVRPTVVVPTSARGWSDERLGLVLTHELAHVRRNDWLVHMAAAVLQTACWFNPLAWLASRELRRLSEQACDDLVLSLGVDEEVYAGHLIDLARVMGTQRHWAPAPAEPMARRSSLEGRVRAMLDTHLNRKPLGMRTRAAIVMALAAVAVPVAAVAVFGQGGPGTLAGTLRDPQGRPVPNTAVTLSQSGNATVLKAQTDAAGAFVFTGVPAGDYMFDPALPGFMKQYPVTVRSGPRTQLDISLRLGQVRESITVASRKGEPPPPPAAARQPPPPPPPYDPAADPCRKPGASACVKPPLKLRDVRPVVPAGREGDPAIVVIEGEIGVDGKIQGAHLSKLGIVGQPAGEPVDSAFGKAALEAVNQWLFAPTRLNGEPVPTAIVITIRFVNRESRIGNR